MRGSALIVALAFQLLHRLLQHGGIHLKAYCFDMPALLAAEHVACAAQFEIERGYLEAGAEVAELFQCC